mmetsp:Transcript_81971/g.240646  ORF Transcript_81971/g.240646 Transcript_81971/m.240646 type:complete len:226 (+) Transcript_81971:569-1246(+)
MGIRVTGGTGQVAARDTVLALQLLVLALQLSSPAFGEASPSPRRGSATAVSMALSPRSASLTRGSSQVPCCIVRSRPLSAASIGTSSTASFEGVTGMAMVSVIGLEVPLISEQPCSSESRGLGPATAKVYPKWPSCLLTRCCWRLRMRRAFFLRKPEPGKPGGVVTHGFGSVSCLSGSCSNLADGFPVATAEACKVESALDGAVAKSTGSRSTWPWATGIGATLR